MGTFHLSKKQIVSLVSDLFTWRNEFTFVYVPWYNFGIPPPVTLLFLLDIFALDISPLFGTSVIGELYCRIQ